PLSSDLLIVSYFNVFRPPPRSTLFPYTTLFRSRTGIPLSWGYAFLRRFHAKASALMVATPSLQAELKERGFGDPVIWSRGVDTEDRKSTRLNSSHVKISYAVFCLKKKKKSAYGT